MEQSREFLQKSLITVHPEIDKFGIMLKPEHDPKSKDGLPRMIGILGTKGHYEGHGEELAYILHCDYWNKGYMPEALVAFAGPQGIYWDFENRKHINTLVAMIDEENVPSMKTITKIGGIQSGRIVKEYALARDRNLDGVVPHEKLRDVVCWYVGRPITDTTSCKTVKQ